MKTFELFSSLNQILFGVLDSLVVVWSFSTRLLLVVLRLWAAIKLGLLLLRLVKSWLWLLENWLGLVCRLLIRIYWLLLWKVELRGLVLELRIMLNILCLFLLWWSPFTSWGLDNLIYLLFKSEVCHHIYGLWLLIETRALCWILHLLFLPLSFLPFLLFFLCFERVASRRGFSRLQTFQDDTGLVDSILPTILPLRTQWTEHCENINEMTGAPPCNSLSFTDLLNC